MQTRTCMAKRSGKRSFLILSERVALFSAIPLLVGLLCARPASAAEAATKSSASKKLEVKNADKKDQSETQKSDKNSADEKKESGDKKESSEDEILAGHSYHGDAFNEGPRQAAYLMSGTGNISFPIKSKVSAVQKFINQGVGQLHGFWYFEAERTFRQAAFLDPDCAAAYWGMAMSNANNKDRAKKFIAEADKRKKNATPRVQRYIAALKALLNAKSKDKKSASEKYIKELEKIFYDFPDDIEAKAFIALHMWEGRRNGLKIYSHLAVNALIGEVLAANPQHPVHHYRIHLWDYEKPELALASAARCGQAAPSIAHMWHMPGHIFSRLKRYDDAVWQQEASARTDHAQMMRDQLLPDQIHNFAHNNEWLIRNLMFIGKISAALDLAKNMTELPRHPKYNSISKRGSSSFYGRLRLFQVLDQAELWPELIALSNSPYLEPTDDFKEQIKRQRFLGRAYYRSGQPSQGQLVLSDLEERLCQENEAKYQAIAKAERKATDEHKSKKNAKKEDLKKEIKKATDRAKRDHDLKLKRIQKAIDEFLGYDALMAGKPKEALELFKKATEISTAYSAEVELQTGDTEKAIKKIRDYADKKKNETLPLANLANILRQSGKHEEAKKAFERLRKNSANIDLAAPPFRRLAPIAEELNLPKDWRIASEVKSDIGERPDLDQLGPFRWQPSIAPNWELTDSTNQKVSLSSYRGRPVVVIFYLGFGCLHCAEQLQAFAPEVEKFQRAGLDLIAISTDNQAKLKESLVDFGNRFAFPLVSDASLEVFKAYRVFDDFEKQPLHGTFIIDGNGKIRWHDISYEPFMDHEFVLDEAVRLLGQDDTVTNSRLASTSN